MSEESVLTPTSIAGLDVYSPSEIEHISFLVYGEAGVGKTRLAASAVEVEDCGPVLLVDIEGGSSSAALYPGLDVVRASDYVDFAKIYKWLRTEEAAKGRLPYKTVIIDSITEAQKLGMDHILKETAKKAKEEKDRDKDPDVPEMSDYGRSRNQMTQMIRAYRNLGCTTIFTALEQVDLSRPSQPKAKPLLFGKFADEVSGYLDIVLRMYKREDKRGDKNVIRRVILSESTGDIIAKDRSDKLPTIMPDPTFKEIYETIRGVTSND